MPSRLFVPCNLSDQPSLNHSFILFLNNCSCSLLKFFCPPKMYLEDLLPEHSCSFQLYLYLIYFHRLLYCQSPIMSRSICNVSMLVSFTIFLYIILSSVNSLIVECKFLQYDLRMQGIEVDLVSSLAISLTLLTYLLHDAESFLRS